MMMNIYENCVHFRNGRLMEFFIYSLLICGSFLTVIARWPRVRGTRDRVLITDFLKIKSQFIHISLPSKMWVSSPFKCSTGQIKVNRISAIELVSTSSPTIWQILQVLLIKGPNIADHSLLLHIAQPPSCSDLHILFFALAQGIIFPYPSCSLSASRASNQGSLDARLGCTQLWPLLASWEIAGPQPTLINKWSWMQFFP